ncbi:phage protease [Shewanella xiamenensis]|uniref:phage protease n=2 Tax=Pseudomonadota TaxID=1224 RepID=UPI002E7BA108|nr:phage protease [Shewanella xiamenensis]
MPRLNAIDIAVAALSVKASPAVNASASETVGTVACSLALESGDTSVQLLPDGLFKATDGRPFDVPTGQWLMNDAAWQSIQAAAKAKVNDFHFDYEHQTLNAEKNGQPAPAAGWFKGSSLSYVPGQGLFANPVEWTPKASAHIAAKEYRYISAVFSYSKTTGQVLELLHVALTNQPALDGMRAIAALKSSYPGNPTNGDNTMNEELLRLLAALGISVEGVNLEDAAALKALIDKAIAAIKANTDSATAAATEIAALKAKSTGIDISEFVPVAAFNELQVQVAALSKQAGTNAVAELLEKEKAKIYGKSDREWLETVGKEKGVAALKAMLNERVAIAALTTTQTTTTTTDLDKDKGLAALTAEDKEVADLLGISHKDFAASKKG